MNELLERQFRLRENGTTVSTEIIAYVIMMVSAERMKDLSIGHYLLAGLLCYYFYSMAQL